MRAIVQEWRLLVRMYRRVLRGAMIELREVYREWQGIVAAERMRRRSAKYISGEREG